MNSQNNLPPQARPSASRLGLTVSTILILVAIGGYFLYARSHPDRNTSAQNQNTNTANIANTQDFTYALAETVTTDGQKEFASTAYDFSFIAPDEFKYGFNGSTPDPQTLMITRPNADTSETSHRDTPNGFNTAADDRMTVNIMTNDRRIMANDITTFTSWYDAEFPTTPMKQAPTVKNLGNNTVFETIEADGIGSFGRNIYVLGNDYIVQFSSDDVPKDELYSMAATFTWTTE